MQTAAGSRGSTEAGSGQVREKQRSLLADLIDKINDLFSGDLTEEHKIAFYEGVEASVLGSETLRQQARHNSEQQFANSPDLPEEILNAVMDTDAKFGAMMRQVLDDDKVRRGLKDALVRGGLWSKLRGGGTSSQRARIGRRSSAAFLLPPQLLHTTLSAASRSRRNAKVFPVFRAVLSWAPPAA